jgi:hypothetical protein
VHLLLTNKVLRQLTRLFVSFVCFGQAIPLTRKGTPRSFANAHYGFAYFLLLFFMRIREGYPKIQIEEERHLMPAHDYRLEDKFTGDYALQRLIERVEEHSAFCN